MPDREEKQVSIQIKNLGDITIYTKAHADIVKIMPNVHSKFEFGILLADIAGHKNENISEIERKLLEDSPQTWYKKESATEALYTLSKKINEEKKEHQYDGGGHIDRLQMSSILYFLFTKNSVNYANSAMTTPIIIREKQLIKLDKKYPPIGFFQSQKENSLILKKGDILFMHTDGLTDNYLEYGKVPEELRQEAEKEINFLERQDKKGKVNNIFNYEARLLQIVQENPKEDLEILKKIVISQIGKHKQLDIQEEILKEKKRIEDYNRRVDDKIWAIMNKMRDGFKYQICNMLKENRERSPQELRDKIIQDYNKDIFPKEIEKKNLDDVSIVIVKKL